MKEKEISCEITTEFNYFDYVNGQIKPTIKMDKFDLSYCFNNCDRNEWNDCRTFVFEIFGEIDFIMERY